MPEPAVLSVAILRLKIGAPRAFGPSQSLGKAIVGGVAIYNDGRRPVLLRGVDLYRAMAASVTSHHDFAPDVHSGSLHLGVVWRQSVIHVNHGRLNLTGSGVSHKCRHQFRVR